MDIYLRTLINTDAPAMLEWMQNPEVQKSFGRNFKSMRIKDCERFISQSQHHETADLHMAISTIDGAYVGTVSLKHINHNNSSAEFAIVIHPNYQGHDVGMQAMKQIARVGFKVIGLKTIYLNVKKSNVAANGLYQKFGCTQVTAEELQRNGIMLYLPETDEEMNWYVIPNRYKV